MKKVAIVCGGYSSEKDISLKSGQTIYQHLDKDLFEPYIVFITRSEWSVIIDSKHIPINKADFSFSEGGTQTFFDFAYITIHGTPGEDGKLQGYFDIIQLPYSNSGVMASSLTFNKWACNQFLKSFKIPIAENFHIKKGEKIYTEKIISKTGLPCFVKPNDGGSSFGISLVKEENNLASAIAAAFKEGEEVIVESKLTGRELTCGVYQDLKEIIALPVTEIIAHGDFFDYQAKYEGSSDEVTPAKIDDDIRLKVQEVTQYIYRLFQLKGFARVDYILVNDTPAVIEVNSVPGMSPASIIPQQVKADQKELKTVLTSVITSCLDN